MILYGIISRQSVSALFLGGLVVGVITLIAYILLIIVRVKLNPQLAPPVQISATRAEKIRALGQTWPVLLIVIGVFAGLFGGAFTPTEAGAIGAMLSTIVALLYRTLTFKALRMAITETLTIAVGASLLTRFLALSGIGDALSDAILGFGAAPLLIMIGIVCVYLALGMMLEPVGAMLLTLPIVLPIVEETGYSLLWFGVVLVKLLEIGMITPPMGMNVFVIKGVVGNTASQILIEDGDSDNASLSTIFKGVFWFVIVDLLIVAALIAMPDIVMFLPDWVGR